VLEDRVDGVVAGRDPTAADERLERPAHDDQADPVDRDLQDFMITRRGPMVQNDMTVRATRTELVHRLFTAWSSGDPERLEPLFHPDALFSDSVNGPFRGWRAIRDFYAGT
jgi:hypothetical protein